MIYPWLRDVSTRLNVNVASYSASWLRRDPYEKWSRLHGLCWE